MELTDTLFEVADPGPQEIRRWIGQARKEGAAEERTACAELVREAAKVEREVAATWEQEARELAPGADALHLKACSAIALGHVGFAERLDDLANEIERRGGA